MKTKRKIAWWEIYSLGIGTSLLLLFGASELHKNKQNNLEQTTIQETTQDSIPQVTNYEFIPPLTPVYKDPLRNIYSSEQ